MRDEEERIPISEQYGSYYELPEDQSYTKHGIISLVLAAIGILMMFIPIVGMVLHLAAIFFGVKGLKAIKKGYAVVGLMLAIAFGFMQLFFIILLITKPI